MVILSVDLQNSLQSIVLNGAEEADVPIGHLLKLINLGMLKSAPDAISYFDKLNITKLGIDELKVISDKQKRGR